MSASILDCVFCPIQFFRGVKTHSKIREIGKNTRSRTFWHEINESNKKLFSESENLLTLRVEEGKEVILRSTFNDDIDN